MKPDNQHGKYPVYGVNSSRFICKDEKTGVRVGDACCFLFTENGIFIYYCNYF